MTTQTYVYVRADVLRRAVGVLDVVELEGEGGTGTAHRQTRHFEGVVGKPVGKFWGNLE